jgi:hypothetical protein
MVYKKKLPRRDGLQKKATAPRWFIKKSYRAAMVYKNKSGNLGFKSESYVYFKK